MAASFHTSGVSSTGLPADGTETAASRRNHPEALFTFSGLCLTRVARRGLGILLARFAGHTNIQIGAPELGAAALTCAQE